MRNFIRRLSGGKKTLRIATTLTGAYTLPQPEGVVYAPMEMTEQLVRGLEARGHQVTVYAPQGSKIACSKLVTGNLEPLFCNKATEYFLHDEFTRDQERNLIRGLWDAYLLSELYKDATAGKFDLVHAHSPDRAMPFARTVTTLPTVYTLHDPLFLWRQVVFEKFSTPNQHFVTISRAQKQGVPFLKKASVIHNGVAVDQIKVGNGKGKYLLFLGRPNPQKGLDVAIKVAQKSGDELLIVGPQPNPNHQEWWDKKIKPHLKGNIRYVGPVWGQERFKYFGDAKAFLFPIQGDEAFGLVMIEAMACGTPVIALNRSSVPEVVKHGVTGFVEQDLKGLVGAVKKVSKINRADCRTHVEDNFSLTHMVDQYEQLFLKLAK